VKFLKSDFLFARLAALAAVGLWTVAAAIAAFAVFQPRWPLAVTYLAGGFFSALLSRADARMARRTRRRTRAARAAARGLSVDSDGRVSTGLPPSTFSRDAA
jgi:fatty acid desaturase